MPCSLALATVPGKTISNLPYLLPFTRFPRAHHSSVFKIWHRRRSAAYRRDIHTAPISTLLATPKLSANLDNISNPPAAYTFTHSGSSPDQSAITPLVYHTSQARFNASRLLGETNNTLISKGRDRKPRLFRNRKLEILTGNSGQWSRNTAEPQHLDRSTEGITLGSNWSSVEKPDLRIHSSSSSRQADRTGGAEFQKAKNGTKSFLGPSRKRSALHTGLSRLSSQSTPRLRPASQSSDSPETWQVQKKALESKLGEEGWMPRKRLSPDTLELIRSLHTQDPTQYSTEKLADGFKISPEAIRRILKSKWRPSEVEEADRRERWQRRGESIWNQMAELGLRPRRTFKRRRATEESSDNFEEDKR